MSMNTRRDKDKCLPLPIAIYCTEQKRCVMIFASMTRTDKYVFAPLKYSPSRSRYLVQNKGKTNKNVFGKMLAFRYANVEQKEILGEDGIVILDEAFVRPEIVRDKDYKITPISKSRPAGWKEIRSPNEIWRK